MTSARRAIVTGGLSGIGLAVVKRLSADGMRVAVGSRRGGDRHAVARVERAIGDTGVVAPLDVTSTASVAHFVERVTEDFGGVDILVNAAGIAERHAIATIDDAQWQTMMDVNLNGPLRLIRACLPAMTANRFGRIVNIASTAARVSQPNYAAYCASKAALVSLSQTVAVEYAAVGIACVSVSPGWVDTEMLQASAQAIARQSGHSVEQERAIMAASNPQGRLLQPEEVAHLVAFCCSDAAGGVTMEDVQINAGALW